MQLFYVPEITGNEVNLSETESKHAVRVLRLSVNDHVQLIDGAGGFYLAAVKEANAKRCRLTILQREKEYGKRNYQLHLAIAPTKNIDRFEWFLEKSTEIGIDRITPIISVRSERKVIKPERLNKILISAMKQSLRAYLPVLEPLTEFNDFVAQPNLENKYIAHCNESKKKHLKNLVKPGESATVLIGPEGDFSPEEIELAKVSGFKEISLGDARLRTETAGIVACHIVNLINET